LKRLTSTKFHIAMAHGSLYVPGKTAEDDHVFRAEEIEASGMDYIALGHWHNKYACPQKPPAWYPGSPEWLPGQEERGSILLVTISDTSAIKIEPREVGLRGYDEIGIEMSEVQDSAKLEAKTLQGANPNLVRRVTLKGLRDAGSIVDTEKLENEFKDKFFHLMIINRSHPKLEDFSETAYEERSIKATFLRLMREKIARSEGEEKNLAEDALQYGLALLEGKEVL
jgi:exonuclease SbcD